MTPKLSLLVAVVTPPTQSSQPSVAGQNAQVSNTLGGFVVTFVFIAYILVGLQYRRHKKNRANRTDAILQEFETLELQEIETLERKRKMTPEIETLERIWKMSPPHRPKRFKRP